MPVTHCTNSTNVLHCVKRVCKPACCDKPSSAYENKAPLPQDTIIESLCCLLSSLKTNILTLDPLINWTQIGQDINGEAAGDESGRSVSLSADGNRVAIGARFNDGGSADSGHTRIYQFNGTTWTQIGQDIDGEATGDQSGISVSLSADGNRVAIGAIGNDGVGSNSGHTRIYQLNGMTWVQIGQDIDGEAAVDFSGISVSLSADGNRVAIGAPSNDDGGLNSGHTRIYQFNGTTIMWDKIGQDIDGEAAGDQSGISVSLSADGNRVAIGANGNDGGGVDSGRTRIFQFNGTTIMWEQIGQNIDGEAAGDQSGLSVSLSADGNRVAIGARFNNGGGGHTRIYQFNGTAWTQLGQDIDGEAANDLSGSSVSLSADGNRVAIGAIFNDGGGSNSGHTRIYQFNGTTWNQIGLDIDGEAINDFSGVSVSLSADGNRVAIGAEFNSGGGVSSGHTRIYERLLPNQYKCIDQQLRMLCC
jgi:hypothetical protein